MCCVMYECVNALRCVQVFAESIFQEQDFQGTAYLYPTEQASFLHVLLPGLRQRDLR